MKMKRLIALLALVCTVVGLFAGCAPTPAQTLNNMEDAVLGGYMGSPETLPPSVLDNLNLMLDQYVSGLRRPTPGNIQQTIINPADSTDPSDPSDPSNPSAPSDPTDPSEGIAQCSTLDEMKALILQTMAQTKDFVVFEIDAGIFNFDVLYDVIFNQLTEEYMLETLGMQSYKVTAWDLGNNRMKVELTLIYLDGQYSLEQVQQMKDESLAKAKEIIRQLDLANKTTYEQVAAVNQYLCDNCVYPDTEPYTNISHTIYGALIEQSAVCEGYARAAQMIFEMCGISTYYVTGDTSGGGHAWNLVQVDGQWYQLDCTWNDADGQPNMYFLVTDSYMSLSRTWDTSRYPASATTPYQP